MDSTHIFIDEFDYFCRCDWFQDIGAASREEGIDHGEARILGGGSDESDDPFLYPWEEDILL